MFTDNPEQDYAVFSREREKRLERLPICSECEHPIQQESAFYINDEWLCDDCADSYRREVVEE